MIYDDSKGLEYSDSSEDPYESHDDFEVRIGTSEDRDYLRDGDAFPSGTFLFYENPDKDDKIRLAVKAEDEKSKFWKGSLKTVMEEELEDRICYVYFYYFFSGDFKGQDSNDPSR